MDVHLIVNLWKVKYHLKVTNESTTHLTVTKYSGICIKHFEEDDIIQYNTARNKATVSF